MFHPWQSRPVERPETPPWIRHMIASTASVCVQLTPEELAALQRVADRVQAGEYRLDRASELTLRLLAYKGAVERGIFSDTPRNAP